MELKREKWIKKYQDLQLSGLQQSSESGSGQNIKMKSIDQLVKDYQHCPELNTHAECIALYKNLVEQQDSC